MMYLAVELHVKHTAMITWLFGAKERKGRQSVLMVEERRNLLFLMSHLNYDLQTSYIF